MSRLRRVAPHDPPRAAEPSLAPPPDSGAVSPTWDARAMAALRRRLLAWFRRSARDLPWRRTKDVYQIWISEIMLQQTQVATVIPYFERFVARFPTIQALAEADEHEVLRHWEGLGYYRRARQLHEAARRMVEQHQGRFPDDFSSVLQLPGIGRYTAGAILSIARDERWPILEANTIRLFSRLLLYTDDPRDAVAQQRFWEFAAAILPRRHVGEFNQSLMELGSEICRPREPLCLVCPLQPLCPTSALGWHDRIPAPARKKVYEDVTEVALVVSSDEFPGRVLLRRCAKGERWAGLWDFPRFSVAEFPHEWSQELTSKVRAAAGIEIDRPEPLTVIKHGVTRYRITLHCFTARARSAVLLPGAESRWVPAGQLEQFALSSTGRRISQLIGQWPPAKLGSGHGG